MAQNIHRLRIIQKLAKISVVFEQKTINVFNENEANNDLANDLMKQLMDRQ